MVERGGIRGDGDGSEMETEVMDRERMGRVPECREI